MKKNGGGHGHTPALALGAGQTDVVGRRGMDSKTCMSPTVGHKQRTGVPSQRKAENRRYRKRRAAQGSA